jgi:hypothetical protein
MTKFQIARLDSLKLIVKESKNNPNALALVPKFGVVISLIETICAEIEKRQIEQGKVLTGITTDKELTFENLTDSTAEIAGASFSWAHDRNDNALMAKVNYKATAIDKMTQSEVVGVAGIVLEEALKIPADELANEGISPDEMNAFQQLIDHFKEVKSAKHEAVIDRVSTTENMSGLFKEASSLLKNKLNRLAVQFKRKDPEFYLKYKAARSVQTRAAQKKVVEKEANKPA